jgi:hypothetical protein
MSLDIELEEAVQSAVADAKQPKAVAQRLIAWLKEFSEDELGPEDQARHLANVRSALKIGRATHED